MTEAEIRARLSRCYTGSQVEEAMAKLKEYRFLDDEALITDYTRGRLHLSPRSARLICAELERRGIAEEDFLRVFRVEFPDYDEFQTALKALKDQFRSSALKSMSALPPQKSRDKVLRFLVSRGFSYEVMMAAWEEFRKGIKIKSDEIYGESE